jgi:hypothetical protein
MGVSAATERSDAVCTYAEPRGGNGLVPPPFRQRQAYDQVCDKKEAPTWHLIQTLWAGSSIGVKGELRIKAKIVEFDPRLHD